ncbi:MAG: SDR family oxidoreductase [Spirochaetes bacterium]|nr:SDR family oxidoreductase [Spirochaetota bacterium]
MDCRDKTIVITGANGGIGKVTARELAAGGARIVLACRNLEAALAAADEIRRGAPGCRIELVRLDLASFASVRACAAEIAQRFGKIDVLINNAGNYTQGDVLTGDGIHPTMQANYFSPFLLTNLLLPNIEASGRGRIVSLSSAMYVVGRLDLDKPGFLVRKNGFSAYAGSKLAVLLFTLKLAERLSGRGVTVNAVHPGLVNTKIMTLHKWYDFFIRSYMNMKSIDAEEGARTSIWAASSEEAAGLTGKYFVRCAVAPIRIAAGVLAMRDELWEKTMAVVGL